MKRQKRYTMYLKSSNLTKNIAIAAGLLALSLPSAFAQPKAKCQNATINVWCTPQGVPVSGLDNGSTGGTLTATYNGTPVSMGSTLLFDCSNAGTNPVILTVTG